MQRDGSALRLRAAAPPPPAAAAEELPAPPARLHYQGRPLAPRPPLGAARHQRFGAAPPRRVVRPAGVKEKDAKKADPNTPPLDALVYNPFEFYAMSRDNDGSHMAKMNKPVGNEFTTVSSVWSELGQSNPSLLLACQKSLGCGTLVFNGDKATGTGEHHNGHSEWKHRISSTAPLFRKLLEEGSKYPIKGTRADLVLDLLDCKEAGVTGPDVDSAWFTLRHLNAQGPDTWADKNEAIKFEFVENCTPNMLADYVAAMFMANGSGSIKNKKKRGTATPTFTITCGRDAPGLIAPIHRKLGFGSLGKETANSCPGVPDGEYSKIEFYSRADLTKFFSLLNGEAVELACGRADATPSGLPRCAGKMLKARVLLEFAQSHQKVKKGKGGRSPERFTMLYKKGAWWCDAKNWRTMHQALYPGVPVPDWEH